MRKILNPGRQRSLRGHQCSCAAPDSPVWVSRVGVASALGREAPPYALPPPGPRARRVSVQPDSWVCISSGEEREDILWCDIASEWCIYVLWAVAHVRRGHRQLVELLGGQLLPPRWPARGAGSRGGSGTVRRGPAARAQWCGSGDVPESQTSASATHDSIFSDRHSFPDWRIVQEARARCSSSIPIQK